MKIITCGECGSKISPDDNKCRNCGAEITISHGNADRDIESGSMVPPKDETPRERGYRISVLILICYLLCSIFILPFILFISSVYVSMGVIFFLMYLGILLLIISTAVAFARERYLIAGVFSFIIGIPAFIATFLMMAAMCSPNMGSSMSNSQPIGGLLEIIASLISVAFLLGAALMIQTAIDGALQKSKSAD